MGEEKLSTPPVPLQFRKNGAGLNSTASALSVEKEESPDLQNIDFDKFGAFRKRQGSATLNSSAFNSGAAWTSLHWLELSTDTDYLMGTCGDKLAKMDSLDGTWDDITGALTITPGNNNHFQWITFLDTALGTNGVDVPIQWTGTGNGSAAAVPTNLTKAKWIESFTPNSYYFLGNVTVSGTAHPSRVYWSDLNALTFTDTNFNEVARNDGTAITGLKMLGEELIIFKEHSIFKALFTGDRDIPFVFVRTKSSVGCVGGYSIQEVSNGLIFMAEDGFYYFDGSNSFKMSDRITATLGDMEESRFPNAVSCYQHNKNRYWSSETTSGGTTHNRNIMFDSYNNSWSLYRGLSANCFARVRTSGEERIYFGDYSGFVYRADTTNTDNPLGVATAINAYFYSKWHDFEDIVHSKGTPHIYIYYQLSNATLTFSYAYDGESVSSYNQTFSTSGGAALYGTATYDSTDTYASTGSAIVRRDLTSRGRLVQFKYANATSGETFQINGYGTLTRAETYV